MLGNVEMTRELAFTYTSNPSSPVNFKGHLLDRLALPSSFRVSHESVEVAQCLAGQQVVTRSFAVEKAKRSMTLWRNEQLIRVLMKEWHIYVDCDGG